MCYLLEVEANKNNIRSREFVFAIALDRCPESNPGP